jgi:hypothetical protein
MGIGGRSGIGAGEETRFADGVAERANSPAESRREWICVSESNRSRGEIEKESGVEE